MKARHQTLPITSGLLAGALALVLALGAGGCAPTAPPPPESRPGKPQMATETRLLLGEAGGLHQKGQALQAREVYRKALENAQTLEGRARAMLGMAKVAESEDAYEESLSMLDNLAKLCAAQPTMVSAVEGELMAAELQARLGQTNEARRRVNQLAQNVLASLRMHEQGLLRNRMENAMAMGRGYQALSEALIFKADEAYADEKEDWGRLVARACGQMPSHDSISLAKKTSNQYLKSAVIVGLVNSYLRENNPDKAQWALNQLRKSRQASLWGAEIEQVQVTIAQGRGVKENSVGVILPLSGIDEERGRRLLAAIKLALNPSLPGSRAVALHAEDSRSDPVVAAEAVNRLAKQNQVMAIIGPVAPGTAMAAARQAQRLGIPILTLSQDPGVLEVGKFSFQSGYTDQEQVATLMRQAVTNGLFSLATLAPETPRGGHLAELAAAWVNRQTPGNWPQKVKLVRSISYPPGQKSLDAQIKTLVGLPAGKYRPNHPSSPKPVVDFHGIFIPDSAARAADLSPRLAYYGISKVALLGIDQWHHARLLSGDPKLLEGSLFPDAYDPHDTGTLAVRFRALFREATGKDPTTPEAMAHDCGLIFRKVLDLPKPPRDRAAFRGILSALGQVDGACGILTLPADRRVRTPLKVFSVQRGAFVRADTGAKGTAKPRNW